MKQGFLYETHMHTAEVSRCAVAPARLQVRFYKARGYTGVCVTDHFINSYSTPEQCERPWKDRVDDFCKGYYEALDEGKKLGISVFFGWEYTYQGADFLTFGLSPAWLLEHPEIMDVDPNKYGDFIHEHGGYVIHAHPFREAWYIKHIKLMPRQVDAVEILNANRSDFENEAAQWYAEAYDLATCAGSDNHAANEQKRLQAVCSPKKLDTVEDLIELIRSRKAEFITLPGGYPEEK